MAKIGIITFHFALNYGAVLQAYALSKCLKSMGHETFLIDYRPDYHLKRYQWQWNYSGLLLTNYVYPLLHKRFSDFVAENLRLSPQLYRTLEELVAKPPEADAYICGSDQVWNPVITGFDPAYFLNFTPHGTKRVAYAGSFGKKELTMEQCKCISPYVEEFDHLSVREASAVDIVKDMCGKDSKHVLDPTLLIDDYESVSEPCPIKNRYVLVVEQPSNSILSRTSDFVSRELGIPKVVINNYSPKVWHSGKWVLPGPGGYLGLFQHADFVITNSFHATVFSHVYNKPFLSVPRLGYMKEGNTRITELLNLTGLSTRFLGVFSNVRIRELIETTIDWASARQRLHNARKDSLRFLQGSLNRRIPSNNAHDDLSD